MMVTQVGINEKYTTTDHQNLICYIVLYHVDLRNISFSILNYQLLNLYCLVIRVNILAFQFSIINFGIIKLPFEQGITP